MGLKRFLQLERRQQEGIRLLRRGAKGKITQFTAK